MKIFRIVAYTNRNAIHGRMIIDFHSIHARDIFTKINYFPLTQVVAKERPDLEKLKKDLTRQQNEFKITLKSLEVCLTHISWFTEVTIYFVTNWSIGMTVHMSFLSVCNLIFILH